MSSENKKTDTANDGRQLVLRAAGLVGLFLLLARIVGLVREIVIRSVLGIATVEATAFEIASRFPESIFLIIAGGAIGSAFIPTFTAYFEHDDTVGGWHLFSAIINLITTVVAGVALICAWWAPEVVQFFAGEQISQSPELLPLTVLLMRIMLISPVVFAASGVIMGALNARQHFLLPALAPTLYTLGIIVTGLIWPFFSDSTPAIGFAIGTVIGSFAHLFIQLPGLKEKQARYTAVFTIHDPGVIKVLKLMAPRVLGLSFSEINKFLILYLTDPLMTGSLVALNTALRIMIMPQGIIGQAMGVAAFPTMSSLAARGAFAELRQILSDALRVVLFLGFPASVLFMVLREQLVALLFERGASTAEEMALVSWALLFFAIGLVALTALEVVARTFYALSDTLTPVLVGGVQIVLMWLLSSWLAFRLFPHYGLEPLGGIAAGFSISNIAEVLLLLWLLRRRLGSIHGRILFAGFWRMGLAAAAMAGAMWLVIQQMAASHNFWQIVIATAVGGFVYLGACWLLQLQELHRFIAYGQQKLKR
jgi:putative peptidoglycan lipid II flippase